MDSKIKKYTNKQLLKFIIPSIIGILLFLTPFKSNDTLTILVAFLIDFINDIAKPFLFPLTVFFCVFPAIALLIINSINYFKNSKNIIINLLKPSLVWSIIRIIGAFLAICVIFKLGPEWIWHEKTGYLMLYEIGPIVLAIYFISSLLLAFVTDYGLMEFIGTFLNKIFEKLMKMPGRTAVDAMVSWLTDSTMGIILSTQQYKKGFYTMREACVMASTFSIISLAYAYLMLKLIGLSHYFISWYFSVTVAGIVCAMIMPRIYPLSKKPDVYFNGQPLIKSKKENGKLFEKALELAVERAAKAPPIKQQFKTGLFGGLDVAISVYPTMMVIGCIGLGLAEFTSIFNYLAIPFIHYFELFNLSESEKAAPFMLAGVVDSLIGPVLGSSIESELTRFVLAGVAVNQLIFMTEPAILMLRANIGLKLWDLITIYLFRVIITIPIMVFCGRYLFKLL